MKLSHRVGFTEGTIQANTELTKAQVKRLKDSKVKYHEVKRKVVEISEETE